MVLSFYIRLRDATNEGIGAMFHVQQGLVIINQGCRMAISNRRRHHLTTRWDLNELPSPMCEAVICIKARRTVTNSGIALDGKYGEGTSEELELLARQHL